MLPKKVGGGAKRMNPVGHRNEYILPNASPSGIKKRDYSNWVGQ